MVPSKPAAQQHRQPRWIDAASIAPQDQHVQGECRDEQRTRDETHVEIDQEGNGDHSEAEPDCTLKDRRCRHDGCNGRDQTPAQADTISADYSTRSADRLGYLVGRCGCSGRCGRSTGCGRSGRVALRRCRRRLRPCRCRPLDGFDARFAEDLLGTFSTRDRLSQRAQARAPFSKVGLSPLHFAAKIEHLVRPEALSRTFGHHRDAIGRRKASFLDERETFRRARQHVGCDRLFSRCVRLTTQLSRFVERDAAAKCLCEECDGRLVESATGCRIGFANQPIGGLEVRDHLTDDRFYTLRSRTLRKSFADLVDERRGGNTFGRRVVRDSDEPIDLLGTASAIDVQAHERLTVGGRHQLCQADTWHSDAGHHQHQHGYQYTHSGTHALISPSHER